MCHPRSDVGRRIRILLDHVLAIFAADRDADITPRQFEEVSRNGGIEHLSLCCIHRIGNREQTVDEALVVRGTERIQRSLACGAIQRALEIHRTNLVAGGRRDIPPSKRCTNFPAPVVVDVAAHTHEIGDGGTLRVELAGRAKACPVEEVRNVDSERVVGIGRRDIQQTRWSGSRILRALDHGRRKREIRLVVAVNDLTKEVEAVTDLMLDVGVDAIVVERGKSWYVCAKS